MPGAVTTKQIRDGGGTLLSFRVWDESGAGSGPFSFFTVLGADGVKLAKAEDSAHTTADEGVMVFGVRGTDTPAALGASGDYSPIIFDTLGRVHTAPWHLVYETVAASQSNQVLGGSGATGDYLSHLFVVPATTSPGAITIADGSSSPDVQITVFTGGATSVSNLVPFIISLGMKSTTGGWRVTTGSNVSCIAVGNFT